MKRTLFVVLLALLSVCSAHAAEHKTHEAVDPDTAYKNNCMRCHAALPQYSPRMNSTIMMHMRVDANLPADQTEAILAYLNGDSSDADTRQDKKAKPVNQHQQH